MDQLENILMKKSDNCEITVYFPTKKYSDNSGDLTIRKDKFDNLISACLSKFGKYEKTSEISYCIDKKIYKTINKKNVQIFKIDFTEVLNLKKFIVVRTNFIKISNEEFPKLENYNDIRKQNKMIFTTDFGKLNLITQSHTDDKCCYFVELNFTPIVESDKESFKQVVQFLEEQIS